MCIMIYKPSFCRLTKVQLERCWDNNPHGGGVAFLTTSRKFNVFRTMHKDKWVNHCMKNMKRELWIHARYTTRGANCVENNHPFWISNDTIAFMNGTVDSAPKEDVRSDTRIVCQDLLRGMPDGWLSNPTLFELVRGYIHKESARFGTKMMFVNRDGRTWLMNENEGHWHEGMWFSNDWYKKDRVAKTTYYTGNFSTNRVTSSNTVWCADQHKYVPPSELPKDHPKYVAPTKKTVSKSTASKKPKNTTAPKVHEHKNVSKETPEKVISDTSVLLDNPDCLYCGVQLLGASEDNLNRLMCEECTADQDLAIASLKETGHMTDDDIRYYQLVERPLVSLTDEEYRFLEQYEMDDLLVTGGA